MPDITSYYRTLLTNQHKTATTIVMEEISNEINRLLEFTEKIDTSDTENMSTGIETIVISLRDLARKLY